MRTAGRGGLESPDFSKSSLAFGGGVKGRPGPNRVQSYRQRMYDTVDQRQPPCLRADMYNNTPKMGHG